MWDEEEPKEKMYAEVANETWSFCWKEQNQR
jgi:hypothetical protein